MKRVLLVGKGKLTRKQEEALKKIIGEFEIVKMISTVNNPQELSQTDYDTLVSLIFVPVVVSHDVTSKRFHNHDSYYIITQQLGTYSTKKEAEETGADIIYQKTLPDGTSVWVASKTAKIIKNPVVEIRSEKEYELN